MNDFDKATQADAKDIARDALRGLHMMGTECGVQFTIESQRQMHKALLEIHGPLLWVAGDSIRNEHGFFVSPNGRGFTEQEIELVMNGTYVSATPAASVDSDEFRDVLRNYGETVFCSTQVIQYVDAHTARAVAAAREEVAAHQQNHIEELKAQKAGTETMFYQMKAERDGALAAATQQHAQVALSGIKRYVCDLRDSDSFGMRDDPQGAWVHLEEVISILAASHQPAAAPAQPEVKGRCTLQEHCRCLGDDPQEPDVRAICANWMTRTIA
jgi:hypothetical protein